MADASESQRVEIQKLPIGIPGLNEVLGGGLPEYSFNLIAGDPGAGKTTLAHQIMFSLATEERPAVHFTLLGEPPIKMLRYQQQFSFFEIAAVDTRVHFINLTEEALRHDLEAIFQSIVGHIERLNPSVVVVDSFRTMIRAANHPDAPAVDLQAFLQRLAVHLTSWQTTSFLVGEYSEAESTDNPVFTIADGIIWLYQSPDRNSVVRKIRVVKMRGQAPLPGLHTMRITRAGMQVFPRIIRRPLELPGPRPSERLSVGVDELDEMLGGGIPAWDSVLVAGPAGSGKSTLAAQFITAGLTRGETGVIAAFEEHPQGYIERAKTIGPALQTFVDNGQLELLYLRPLDLSVDEALLEIEESVRRLGATRLIIDSLSGFELALAPTFREDFRESLYRMVGALTGKGVTVFMTVEVTNSFTDLAFSPNLVSFLTDTIIAQRYVELEGHLRKVMTVVKMRGSAHSQELRLYDVTEHGLEVGEALSDYVGIISGVARHRGNG